MRFTWTVVPIALAVLGLGATPWGLGQSSTAGSSGQTPKKPTSAHTAALTPQEKEAQRHYRIAPEAIKNNDFSTASDELKAASELAPKNALIWYNLAVVESKRGDSGPALEHLKKAENIGLPRALQNDADQLEAKVTYDAMKEAKKEAFSAKLLELKQALGPDGDNGGCLDPEYDPTHPTAKMEVLRWRYQIALQDNSRKFVILVFYSDQRTFMLPKPYSQIESQDLEGTAAVDFVDLSSDLKITQIPMCNLGQYRWSLILTAKKHGAVHAVGATKERNIPPASEDGETAWVDSDGVELNFSSQDSAQAAAKIISDLIRMSADIQ